MPSVIVFTVLIAFAAELGAKDWAVYEKRDGIEFFSESNISVNSVMAHLNAVRSELSSVFGFEVTDLQPIQVIVFRSTASYRNYVGPHLPEAVNRRAIYYRDGSQCQIYAVSHTHLVTDLRHEYTHALLHEWLPYIPLWIDEGIAEFMEETPETRARSSRLAGMKTRCRLGWSPGLAELEAIPSAASMGSAEYRNSWAWIHYLVSESDQSKKLFRGYLAAIAAGEAAGRFSEWAADRDAAVLRKVGSYYRQFHLPFTGRQRRTLRHRNP